MPAALAALIALVAPIALAAPIAPIALAVRSVFIAGAVLASVWFSLL